MRLIDADELENEIRANGVLGECHSSEEREDDLINMISGCKTVDAIPVVRGEWKFDYDYDGLVCSNCCHVTNETIGEAKETEKGIVWIDFAPNYCPKCGAKMEGVQNG